MLPSKDLVLVVVSIELQIEALPSKLHIINYISAVQWMYHISNPLLCFNSQCALNLLYPNVECTGQFIKRNDRVSCL